MSVNHHSIVRLSLFYPIFLRLGVALAALNNKNRTIFTCLRTEITVAFIKTVLDIVIHINFSLIRSEIFILLNWLLVV